MKSIRCGIVAIFLVLVSFCMVSCGSKDYVSAEGEQGQSVTESTNLDETTENDESQHKYMYGFDAGTLVLRTKNYSDVIRADTIDEGRRETLGFWPIADSKSRMLRNGVVFSVVNTSEGSNLTGNAIVRYDERGIKKELYTTEGYIDLITCEDDCLYFYEYNTKSDDESYLRMNNCFSADVTVDCLAEMPIADIASDNGENALVKKGEWIYFLYTDEPKDITHDSFYSPDMWLYRLSEKTGAIERVESVYNALSTECRDLSSIAYYEGYYMLEGLVDHKSGPATRSLYLFDFESNNCTLLCQSYEGGSAAFFLNEKCYHIHKDAENNVYWAATSINSSASCEAVSNPMNSRLSHFSNLTSVRICGTHFLYTTTVGNYAYWIPLNGAADSFEFETASVFPTAYHLNGITYLYINGAVIYTDDHHAGQWFDSGIRFAEYELYGYLSEATFVEMNGNVYFITFDGEDAITTDFGSSYQETDLNSFYKSVKIKPDFSKRIDPNSGLLRANVQQITPTISEGYPTLGGELGDIYGNTRTGTVFRPDLEKTDSVEYVTSGKVQYMTGVIIVDKYSLSNASAKARIYADDKLVYESPIITVNSEPVEFHVDIKKASVVRVEAVSSDPFNIYIPMGNISLVLAEESFHNLEFLPYRRWLSYNKVSDPVN